MLAWTSSHVTLESPQQHQHISVPIDDARYSFLDESTLNLRVLRGLLRHEGEKYIKAQEWSIRSVNLKWLMESIVVGRCSPLPIRSPALNVHLSCPRHEGIFLPAALETPTGGAVRRGIGFRCV